MTTRCPLGCVVIKTPRGAAQLEAFDNLDPEEEVAEHMRVRHPDVAFKAGETP